MPTTKAHCNQCAGETNHFVQHVIQRDWPEFDDEGDLFIVEVAKYETLQCCGCEDVRVRVTSTGPYPTTVGYWPGATLRRIPLWIHDVDLVAPAEGSHKKAIYALLREVYQALQNAQPALASMGMRAILEAVMVDKVQDQGTFAKNLEVFASAGYVGTLQLQHIEAVLDVGGAAIHRGHIPEMDDLLPLLNLVEQVVESIYVREGEIARAAGRVPPRPPRPIRQIPRPTQPHPAAETRIQATPSGSANAVPSSD
jgi:hypothetical protein